MSSRKQPSGNKKLKNRRRIEQLVKSQKGAIDKLVLIKSNIENNSHLKNENNKDNNNDALRQDEAHGQEQELNIIDSNSVDESEKNIDVDLGDDNNKNNYEEEQSSESIPINIFDPRLWDGLDQKFIDILVAKGPKRDLSIEIGPKDDVSRCFSSTFYTQFLPNGEKHDRAWLVYSKELDRVFCFCCKVFKKGARKSKLANEGYNDW